MCVAWLAVCGEASCNSKPEHDDLKKEIGAEGGYPDRVVARESFTALAAQHAGLFAEVIEFEREQTGTLAEPETVK